LAAEAEAGREVRAVRRSVVNIEGLLFEWWRFVYAGFSEASTILIIILIKVRVARFVWDIAPLRRGSLFEKFKF
jgi:hypothetical protein